MQRIYLLLIISIFSWCVSHGLAFDHLPELYGKSKRSVVTLCAKDSKGKPIRTGTGFFIADGYRIVTNYHVIKGASAVDIKFLDGETVSTSELYAISEQSDLALLKSSKKGEPLILSSNGATVGDEIAVIGSPLGLEGTLSAGVVSAIRELPSMLAYQTTAAISPGNSGAPAIDKDGQVIGITSFTITGGQSLNFAIHSSYISPLLSHKLTHPIIDSWSYQEVQPSNGGNSDKLADKIINKGTRITAIGCAELTLRNNATVAVTNIEGELVCYRLIDNGGPVLKTSKLPTAVIPFILRDTIGPTSEYKASFFSPELRGHAMDAKEPWIISEIKIKRAIKVD